MKIIDPNRPDNNISGGTNKIGLIFDCFSTAYDILQASLAAHENGDNVPSFLEQIVGGNFEAYDSQREYLRELHIGPRGSHAPAVLPPPPPSIEERKQSNQTVPPPPQSSHQAQVTVRTRSSLPSTKYQQLPELLVGCKVPLCVHGTIFLYLTSLTRRRPMVVLKRQRLSFLQWG